MKTAKSILIWSLLYTLFLSLAGANGQILLLDGEGEITDPNAANSAPLADQWQQLDPNTSPPACFGHTMVAIDNKAYVFGGVNYSLSEQQLNDCYYPLGEQLFNDIWAWNNAEAEWLEISQTNLPPARNSHTAVALGSKMYVLFGQDSSGNFFEDMWSYDPNNNIWDEITPEGPRPKARASHSAVVIDDAIYVLGGEDENGSILNDLWRYEPNSNRWEQRAALPAGGVREHAAAAVAGKMYIFCGEDGENPLNDLWVYVPTDDSWTQLDPNDPNDAPSARHGMTVAQYGEWIWLIGGSRPGTDLKETWAFNVATQTWTRCTDCPFSLYKSASAAFMTASVASSPGEVKLAETGSESEDQLNEDQLAILVFGGIDGVTTVGSTFKYFPGIQVDQVDDPNSPE
jgi:N-acetylneuraminic acid mutarotase